jgi:hypothetical protein
MRMDLRLPMGAMFLLLGAILAAYGIVTRGSAIYQRSAGVDINLAWGGVMAIFGALMLVLALRSSRNSGVK